MISDDHMKQLEGETSSTLRVETRLKEYSMPKRESSMPASKLELKLPNFNCHIFSGESHAATECSTFIAQFNNVVKFRFNLSNSVKLTYLRTYLKSYALKVISHLALTDENYLIALALLE